MNYRERFVRIFHHEKVDRIPDYEFGVWDQTYERWHKEGLPAEIKGVWDVIPEYFGTDPEIYVNVNLRESPAFTFKVVEEKGDHQIIQDEDGALCERLKPGLGASIPRYIRYAIETRADWEKFRDERLNPDDPSRLPSNIKALIDQSAAGDVPVTLRGGSLYGYIRNWMGVQNVSIAVCEQPEWIEEMMEHLTIIMLKVYGKLVGKLRVDAVGWWEDMCFRTGSLLSPYHFNLWMVPRYKRVTDFLREAFDCTINHLDCDGNIHDLAGLWLNGGINVMFPLEAAHTDAFRLSAEFGNRMGLRGYYDKIALIEGKEAIDKELARIKPLVDKGGFVPHTDHLVPPDVSFENYCYYRRQKCKLLGKSEKEVEEIAANRRNK
jgi:hypothetical protein